MPAIRDAVPGDIAAIQAIYAHHVLHGLASFEEAPPSVEEMRLRFEAARARGLPYILAELAHVGDKHGRWVDSVLMRLELSPEDPLPDA